VIKNVILDQPRREVSNPGHDSEAGGQASGYLSGMYDGRGMLVECLAPPMSAQEIEDPSVREEEYVVRALPGWSGTFVAMSGVPIQFCKGEAQARYSTKEGIRIANVRCSPSDHGKLLL
jgi:hypothetical protein